MHSVWIEALQMLKFLLKQQRLDFMAGLMTDELDMIEPKASDIDLLHVLSENCLLNGMDDVIASMMSLKNNPKLYIDFFHSNCIVYIMYYFCYCAACRST